VWSRWRGRHRREVVAPTIKVLVLYDSQPGNVEQMATFVAEGASEIQGVEVRIRKIDGEGELKATPEDVLWADGVAVGSPTNMGVLSWKIKRFWDAEQALGYRTPAEVYREG